MRCAEILRPICDVLAEVHASGLVHRDIKPANIFLHQGRAGEIVKVLDFGIAKLVGEVAVEEHQTTEGFVLGTPPTWPRSVSAATPTTGASTSTASAVLLYRMLSGRLPYASNDLLSIARHDRRDRPRSLRELNPAVTPAVDAVVVAAMSPAMDDRPTAEELARQFGRALARRASDRTPAAGTLSTSDTLDERAGAAALVGASVAATEPPARSLFRLATRVRETSSEPGGEGSLSRLFEQLRDVDDEE